MPTDADSLHDISRAFAARDGDAQEGAIHRIADLFVAGAARFGDGHVALFDQVIGLLADTIETRARARLADRLADLPNAPPEVMRRLSKDEIVVARPVLARSPRLSDDDLVEAAMVGGRDHMLAISERRELSEPVTDVLVREGDRVVVNAVAGNPGARFSAEGYDALVARSRSDELLQAAVGRRHDIPARHMAALFELAKAAARERLSAGADKDGRRLVAKVVAASARDVAAETRARSKAHKLAVREVSSLAERGALLEETLVGYARTGKIDHAIVALSYLGKVPPAIAERALASTDTDALLVIARSVDFAWSSVRDLFRMRREHRPSAHEFERLAESYNRLSAPTAQRVLHFMHARENVTASRG